MADTNKVEGTCGVCFDDCELMEYAFDDGVWRPSSVCRECTGFYKQQQFGIWRKMLEHPDCEAALKRLLKGGVIVNIFDRLCFPHAPGTEKDWVVINEENGKEVDIPHPVEKLRDSEGEFDPHLEGAPPAAQAEAWWGAFIEELKLKHGVEYINGLLPK
eukprot:CAMPEP_0201532450 /NCGR_PEP_ID=MMETSP0161_2-20130828/50407_1 /ASSEMBLY_ACC=CAM_ASM_000251 /TAXON_ID=180227 /ORGANISM="Neoparamoeba aestuarina, Strain SoJaBio B1-5/56/2" /LENGTH=158 /DNA_ID=CAMNT_0047935875 /DNA_START=61 /DNA_END=537 /DNA_ORIENTATION=-